MHVLRTTCRSCDSSDLEVVLAYSPVPLADRLLTAQRPAAGNEAVFPLTAVFCHRCSRIQLLETVSPSTSYDDSYRYYSSNSDSILEHAREHAEALIENRRLNGESLVTELAS